MSILDQLVTYDDTLRRGAYLERDSFERLTDGSMSMTVGRLLRLPVRLLWLFKTVMHEEILPGTLIHLLAVKLARIEVDAFRYTGGYVDIRTGNLLNVKEAWTLNLASLGALRSARALANGVPQLLTELAEPRACEVAVLAELAAMEKPGQAIVLTLRWILGNGAPDAESRVRALTLDFLENHHAA